MRLTLASTSTPAALSWAWKASMSWVCRLMPVCRPPGVSRPGRGDCDNGVRAGGCDLNPPVLIAEREVGALLESEWAGVEGDRLIDVRDGDHDVGDLADVGGSTGHRNLLLSAWTSGLTVEGSRNHRRGSAGARRASRGTTPRSVNEPPEVSTERTEIAGSRCRQPEMPTTDGLMSLRTRSGLPCR